MIYIYSDVNYYNHVHNITKNSILCAYASLLTNRSTIPRQFWDMASNNA